MSRLSLEVFKQRLSDYGAGLLLSGLLTCGGVHSLNGFFQLGASLNLRWASLVVQVEKNPPAMQETWVRFLGQEDPLEKRMATHSSILAWRIPWTSEPDGLHVVTKSQPGRGS